MNDQKWNRIMKFFAIGSAVIAFFEGLLYFSVAENGLWVYMVNTIQNTFHTFLFEADISAADAYEALYSGMPIWQRVIGLLYSLAVLLAPVCTVVAVYSAVELLLRRKLSPFARMNKEPVLIFGDHVSLTAAIKNEKSKNYHYYLVTAKAVNDEEEELELVRKDTVIIKLDDYSNYDNNYEILRSKIRLKKIRRIIIAQNTISETLTLYLWLAEMVQKEKLSKDVSIYALCNGNSGDRILEELYYKNLKQKGMPELITFDSNELAARKILMEHFPSVKENASGNSHVVISGGTELAHQLVLTCMNKFVFAADSNLTIDIVDEKVNDTKSWLHERFNTDYVNETEHEMSIGDEDADGRLTVRFFKAGTDAGEYRDLLEKLDEKDNPITYAIVCQKDNDDILSIMLDLQYLLEQKDECKFPVGLEIEDNKLLSKNIWGMQDNYFTFDEYSNIAIEDILYERIDKKAKRYNHIYNQISLYSGEASEEEKKDAVSEEEVERIIAEEWNKMFPFQKSSSRMLADHADVKEQLTDAENLKQWIGEEGTVLKKTAAGWRLDIDDAEFLNRLHENPELLELAKLEHRRWCYALATLGWGYAEGKKDTLRKTNPCMTSWDNLEKTRPDMCKYDLMPYMLMLLQK